MPLSLPLFASRLARAEGEEGDALSSVASHRDAFRTRNDPRERVDRTFSSLWEGAVQFILRIDAPRSCTGNFIR